MSTLLTERPIAWNPLVWAELEYANVHDHQYCWVAAYQNLRLIKQILDLASSLKNSQMVKRGSFEPFKYLYKFCSL